MRSLVLCSMAAALLLGIACAAVADPLPGRDVLKFDQQPMIATPIMGPDGMPQVYYGHDELSTAVWNIDLAAPPVYNGVFMADDFADRFDTPVVHIRWWGSYMNALETPAHANKFLVAFEADVPADDPDNLYAFSHPDCVALPLNTQISTRDMDGILAPMEGTFTEKLVVGSNPNEPVYEYNAELCCPFQQLPDTVYWLKIVALVDHDPNDPIPPLQWGWHNRDYTIWNPLASKPPAVVPGEHVQGALDPGTPEVPLDDILVWHFQDDAVGGDIEGIYEIDPCQVHMDQDHWASTDPSLFAAHYVDEIDGPIGIGQYSKDLAFQLFSVPEPSTLMLLGLGSLLLLARRFWR